MHILPLVIKRFYAFPLVERAIVAISVVGFLGGMLYWYQPQLAITPPYLWPWLIDSPLSVLAYAIALPLVRHGNPKARGFATWAMFGNVKYGLWTVIFWSLWWHADNPFTLESVTMTLTHAVMVIMGFSLLLYYRPRWQEVLGSTLWFALNDYLDYWQGLMPTVPVGVSVKVLQTEQLLVTAGLGLALFFWSQKHTRLTVEEKSEGETLAS